jgi:hypothetical protein
MNAVFNEHFEWLMQVRKNVGISKHSLAFANGLFYLPSRKNHSVKGIVAHESVRTVLSKAVHV